MKKNICIILITLICLIAVLGCNNKENDVTSSDISAMTQDAINNLYSIQLNYSQGTAPLNEIPVSFAESLYNDYDIVINAGIKEAPIMLREYAATNTVYFDYDTDYSIVWDKNAGSVLVEKTDVTERENFKQKQHK